MLTVSAYWIPVIFTVFLLIGTWLQTRDEYDPTCCIICNLVGALSVCATWLIFFMVLYFCKEGG